MRNKISLRICNLANHFLATNECVAAIKYAEYAFSKIKWVVVFFTFEAILDSEVQT